MGPPIGPDRPRIFGALVACLAALGLIAAHVARAAPESDPSSFAKDVQPLLSHVCANCHNPQIRAGNLDIASFEQASSLTSDPEGWTKILARLRAGEMPPPGVPGASPESVASLIAVVQGELNKNLRPRAGRVIAHRLNRAEYSNTIRDVLGVDFRADEAFPADDSGYGFDNIGDVLTVSPVLMQEYLSAAEKIAARAVGGDPLPAPSYVNSRDRIRRVGPGVIEMKALVDYDADYVVKVNLNGSRPDNKPVTLRISVDGKPVKTVNVDVAIDAVNRQGGNTQRRSEEVRVFLTANEHALRAEFLNDDFVRNLSDRAVLNPHGNIFPESFDLGGPFAPAGSRPVAKKVLLCDPASGSVCVERILTTFAHHAYRRPATKAELEELLSIYTSATQSGYAPKQSLQFAIVGALVSPQFLFRIERDPAPGTTTAPVSDLELASRLSYFLWSSAPDDDLLRLAESGQLHQPAVLDAQVKRMIADPRSTAFADNFGGQWLQTRALDAVTPDPVKFPEWNATLRDEMNTETRLFFETVMRENRAIADFIDGKFTFLNENLADYYGIRGVSGTEFRRVDLSDADAAMRSGVFTQASVLTVSSYPTRTSVVLRGKYLLETVLNAPPPPPPPDVPAFDEKAVGTIRSLRAQMETHRADPVCASCHARMDVLGFGLEDYDAIGRWRLIDGRFPIDSTGTFPDGRKFSSPAEMKAILRENLPDFVECLAEKMLTYALGRGVENYDRPALDGIVRETAAGGNRFEALILAVTHSLPFQQREGPAAAAPN
jgi:mono/diheme cytochrome c family protein